MKISGAIRSMVVPMPAAIEVKTPAEFKTKNRGLSPEQQQYELDLIRVGALHDVCCSIEGARAAFDRWGVETREHLGGVFGERAEGVGR